MWHHALFLVVDCKAVVSLQNICTSSGTSTSSALYVQVVLFFRSRFVLSFLSLYPEKYKIYSTTPNVCPVKFCTRVSINID